MSNTMRTAPAGLSVMLDELSLPLTVLRQKEIPESPQFSDFSPEQLLRVVIEPQHTETMSNRYQTNLRLSGLIAKSVLAENFVTGSKRRYTDEVVRQLLSFWFAEDRPNVGVHGVTEARKSYFMPAFCNEAYLRNYRCIYVDYCDLMDELLTLSRREYLNKYRKRLRYYSRTQLLFITDFAISWYSEDGIKIPSHLIKTRTDLGTSTMFTNQYAPSEWDSNLCNDNNCYGKLDGIRQRLATGYTVHIEKL